MFHYPNIDYDPELRSKGECTQKWPDSPVSPDENYTLREIVDNFTRGMPVSAHVYESGSVDDRDLDADSPLDYVDVSSLDLAEITELQRSLNLRAKELRNQLKKETSPSEPTTPPAQTTE